MHHFHITSSLDSVLTSPQVDSAKYYCNEAETAAAIRKSGVDRSQIFHTSKVPRTRMGYEQSKKAIAESIADANLGYIDLYDCRSGMKITPHEAFLC